MTKDELDKVLDDLSKREPIFHRREFGMPLHELEAMTDEDFWKIGASGKTNDRASVIETVLQRNGAPQATELHCREFVLRPLADNPYQLNYPLEEPGRRTRRTTLWQKTGAGWKIVFHQGTGCTLRFAPPERPQIQPSQPETDQPAIHWSRSRSPSPENLSSTVFAERTRSVRNVRKSSRNSHHATKLTAAE